MHGNDPQQRELLRVCRIGRAQGLKGEVNIRITTDEPGRRFSPGASLFTRDGSDEYTVEGARTFKDRWIVHFDGIDSRDAAEALNGIELYAEADDPEEMAQEDAWYPKDLIGLEARLADDNALGLPGGKVLGKIVDVIDGPAQSLLKLRLASGLASSADATVEDAPTTALVPFVDPIVPDIDLDGRTLAIDPPGGLIPGLQ
ncbi:ribosome maturation factor RimM [Bifidobacterium subtile]|uniref:Ribosome maturation factor RimM n=1 Tax=Bifidobacterium subtile TaxID=77635 RepID=A0A087EBZ4_9BIFI|nr:ribosome maturation factor RimM [Bifidobacterium subtile]KFJ05295.1 16S rrNA processing protein [Bifidobacterium subtile]MCI1223863.1 ribosome maturation factor RimM [Bifidobacterium subtile]MCI1241798.1 ribosome maturation factor RimM [Bifidobacterium subtile]MCI1258906.1 ribosome maturation factor RimM [Bifidobacterium subtile]QOL37451.1 ribosome maturation factor RimM [Bifidobacterium subtile]